MGYIVSSKSWKLDHIVRFENDIQVENYYVLKQLSENGNSERGNLSIGIGELQALKNLLKDL